MFHTFLFECQPFRVGCHMGISLQFCFLMKSFVFLQICQSIFGYVYTFEDKQM